MKNKDVTYCTTCGLTCKYDSSGECNGSTEMMADTHEHLCEQHKQHGAPNNWYVSYDTDKPGLVQRMIAEE